MLSTWFLYCLDMGRRLVIAPLSKPLGPPAPQASLSTNARLTSLDQMLIYSAVQFLNSRTSSSFPFSLTSPQIHEPLVVVHGSAPRIE